METTTFHSHGRNTFFQIYSSATIHGGAHDAVGRVFGQQSARLDSIKRLAQVTANTVQLSPMAHCLKNKEQKWNRFGCLTDQQATRAGWEYIYI